MYFLSYVFECDFLPSFVCARGRAHIKYVSSTASMRTAELFQKYNVYVSLFSCYHARCMYVSPHEPTCPV
jgi:hypothetical protein